MTVEQISIFLENKAGHLAEVTETLAKGNINIRALSLADTSDFGILRLIVDNHIKAKEILKAQGLTVGTTEVVAVEVEDHPGGLNRILQVFGNEKINVEYMYAFVQAGGKNATLIIRFDDTKQALIVLGKHKFNIITEDKIQAN